MTPLDGHPALAQPRGATGDRAIAGVGTATAPKMGISERPKPPKPGRSPRGSGWLSLHCPQPQPWGQNSCCALEMGVWGEPCEGPSAATPGRTPRRAGDIGTAPFPAMSPPGRPQRDVEPSPAAPIPTRRPALTSPGSNEPEPPFPSLRGALGEQNSPRSPAGAPRTAAGRADPFPRLSPVGSGVRTGRSQSPMSRWGRARHLLPIPPGPCGAPRGAPPRARVGPCGARRGAPRAGLRCRRRPLPLPALPRLPAS